MRTPDYILDQIRIRYDNNWRDWLVSPPDALSFSLTPPTAHTIARNADAVATWLRAWQEWAHDHPTVHMRTVTRRTLIGTQQVYTHVDLHSVDSLVTLIPALEERWYTATQRYSDTSVLGVPQEQLKPYLAQIVALDDYDFSLLIRIAQWFIKNPKSGLTIRQVPVPGLHTKWLARHRSLVLALLGLPQLSEADDCDDVDVRDLDALGLRPLPTSIDIILTDPEDQQSLSGLRHIRAPLAEIAGLRLRPRQILVIENKQSALPVPDWPGVVVIHSLGNFLDALVAIPWIACAQAWYWGDLDRAGFTLLSRARTRLPGLTSVLMDRDTLSQHIDLAVIDPTGRIDPPDSTLTIAEREALAALTHEAGQLRLEQERIPWNYVNKILDKVLRGPGR
ncbi:DUF2220 family protein [Kibdelosporangium philippinense]|uniref:DUF2220 family protein n=1 Tax=Kibdelosporangium philippinense TaxID=211113 RepID=A0ABS8ZQX4_9PSEU|nr:Wadjet anti-phage system protein JetD domain-containing protein [Kibdelosporangium philippinense]MCE7009997.1 DUF2220 family protein [Kibdelosporangium philippinense]